MKIYLILFVLLFPILNLFCYLNNVTPVFYFNFTKSAPKGIYIIKEGYPKKNDYCLISRELLPVYVKPKFLLKKLRFDNQEYIEIHNQDIFVKNTYVCTIKKNPLVPTNIESFELALDEGFFCNDHPDSFDSRYFGAININKVIKVGLIWKF